MKKVEKWWFVSFELPFLEMDMAEEGVTDIEIDQEGVIAMSTMILDVMKSIFDGDDARIKSIHRGFVEEWKKRK